MLLARGSCSFRAELSLQPQVLDLPRGRRTRAPEPPSPRPASRCPRKRVSSGLAAGRLRPSGVTLPPVTFHLQGRRVAFVCCCHPNSAPLLPGPAGPGPVADADRSTGGACTCPGTCHRETLDLGLAEPDSAVQVFPAEPSCGFSSAHFSGRC